MSILTALAFIPAPAQVASAPAPAAVPRRSLAAIAQEVLDLEAQQAEVGRRGLTDEERYLWSTRLAAALIEEAPANTMKALNDHLARMTRVEQFARELHKGGRTSALELASAEFMRAEAELWVQRKRMR
jgi:hypothetical protein